MNECRWADLALGMSARFTAVITDEAMQRFAEISGDVNPLHVDDAFARSRGFPGRVAFGLLTSSFYSTLVGMYLPGRWALLHGLDIEMKAPAFVGDRLTISGEITHLTEAYKRLEIKASIVNAQGKTISKAKIRAGVHEP
ncbi:MAG TPA: MaoC family dehydratase [Kofleriaceae bacterium]